ncbi:hypothetical protein KKE60_08945 [Patescibacteria group bacterium]|nr:hypothetical protein [Patescibacteria group bacterium]
MNIGVVLYSYTCPEQLPEWRTENFSGVFQITETDSDGMALFRAYGEPSTIREKTQEWDTRGLTYRDLENRKLWEITFRGKISDFIGE